MAARNAVAGSVAMEVTVLAAVPGKRDFDVARMAMSPKRTHHTDKTLKNIHPKDSPWTRHGVNRRFEQNLGILERLFGKLTGFFNFGHLLPLEVPLFLENPEVCSILNRVNT
jgi:hypothetical protein